MSAPVIGKRSWFIADGFMSDTSCNGMDSHEAVCVLNLSGETAHIELTLYFEDAEPMRGLRAECANERTHHIRLDRLRDGEGRAIPRNTPYAIQVESDRPVIVQCSRLDVTQPEYALMTTIAY